jgi:DNA-binding transcriptional regulator YhcF (GntR family)
VAIDPNDPRPPYRQVADDLRHKIAAGEGYAPGARLPSIRRLAKEYGISPQTVQSALRELRQEGLVVSQQGRAFFVRDPGRPADGLSRDDAHERLAALEAELRSVQSRVAALEDGSNLLVGIKREAQDHARLLARMRRRLEEAGITLADTDQRDEPAM